MSLFAKERESHRCRNKLMVARGKVEGGDKLEIGNDIYTLPYLKQVTNKDLPHSTGNSTQYSVMAYMGNESKKEWRYIYIHTYIYVN